MCRILTFGHHPFQCHCSTLLWLISLNQDETTWLVSWLPPIPHILCRTFSGQTFSNWGWLLVSFGEWHSFSISCFQKFSYCIINKHTCFFYAFWAYLITLLLVFCKLLELNELFYIDSVFWYSLTEELVPINHKEWDTMYAAKLCWCHPY
jgi:hypothetical protein